MASSSTSSIFDIEPLDGGETCHHAMDACSLCGKLLAGDRDIYMYRGDTPFCSEECRCHEIIRDECASSLKDQYLTSKEQQRRQKHETPGAAESGRFKLAADVSVAI